VNYKCSIAVCMIFAQSFPNKIDGKSCLTRKGKPTNSHCKGSWDTTLHGNRFPVSISLQRTMLFGDEIECSDEVMNALLSAVIRNGPTAANHLLVPRPSLRSLLAIHWYDCGHPSYPLNHVTREISRIMTRQTLNPRTKSTHFEAIGTV
jgi:hypothetical protein